MDAPRYRDDKWKDAWQALAFVAAAGGLALVFAGLGVWLYRGRGQGRGLSVRRVVSSPRTAPRAQLSSLGGPVPAPNFSSVRVPEDGAEIIVNKTVGGDRFVTISTDVDIQIFDSSNVDGTGLLLPASNSPFDFGRLGASSELYATSVGGSDANVGIVQRRGLTGS